MKDMLYLEEKGVIVAYRTEIDENIEYEYIKKIIKTIPSMWVQLNKEHSIVIFEVIEVCGGAPNIYEEIDDVYEDIVEEVFEDLLCLCTMQVMCDYDSASTAFSDKSYPEQMKEIEIEYGQRGYDIPTGEKLDKLFDKLFVLLDGEPANFTIVPVPIKNFIGTSDEFEEKDEE